MNKTLKDEKISLRLPAEIKERLQNRAEIESRLYGVDISLGKIVLKAIEQYLKKEPK